MKQIDIKLLLLYHWGIMNGTLCLLILKNGPSEFQNIMNDIFYPYSDFSIVYIDNVLIFSNNINQHFKHLKILKDVIKRNSLVLSVPQNKIISTNCKIFRI